MEFRIWVETRLDGPILERELVSSVERPASGIGPKRSACSWSKARPCFEKCKLGLFRLRWMC